MDRHETADDGAVVHGDVPRHLHGVGDDHIVADDGAVPDFHALGHAGVALEHGMGADIAPLRHGDPRTDHAVRADRDVGAELGGRVDEGGPVDHLSTTIAIISASATTCPSTNTAPFILHVLPRNWTISSSKRIWSPGTTGRRNFTLSSDMKYTTLSSTFWPSK